MEKKQNKVVEFVKNHKKTITLGAITAATAVGGIVLIAMGKKSCIPAKFSGVFKTPAERDIEIADWNVGTLIDCWREGGWINAIAKDFTVADAGRLGEEFLKIDGVTPDTVLQTVISFEDSVN